jgi:hypothetical protein
MRGNYKQVRRNYQRNLLVLLIGALSGVLAAIPMTLFMGAAHYLLPKRQRYSLPPRLITLKAAEKVGLGNVIEEEPVYTLATGAAHFGYGADGGILYALLARRIPLPGLARGILFGLAFWATGYLGWIPAAGLLRPATEHPTERTVLMILSNILYGVFTVLFFDFFANRRQIIRR